MNIFKKIKNIFRKKQNLSHNKKKLVNHEEIQKFFEKDSGWQKSQLTYLYDKKFAENVSGKPVIKAYACFYREATQEETEKYTNRKIDCEIELRKPQTLDNLWKDALKEIEQYEGLQERAIRKIPREGIEYNTEY